VSEPYAPLAGMEEDDPSRRASRIREDDAAAQPAAAPRRSDPTALRARENWLRVRKAVHLAFLANKLAFRPPPYSAFLSHQLHAFLLKNSSRNLDTECGQVQHGAVLFADCTGFTALTERLAALELLEDGSVTEDGTDTDRSAEHLCTIINAFFTSLIAIAHVLQPALPDTRARIPSCLHRFPPRACRATAETLSSLLAMPSPSSGSSTTTTTRAATPCGRQPSVGSGPLRQAYRGEAAGPD
jgi:hypothetical protein